MKSKLKLVQHTVSIKRRINVDTNLRNFIFKNSNYRRKVWNDFVEEYHRCRNIGERFNPTKYATKYYNEVERKDPDYKSRCSGIREQVSKDVRDALKVIYAKKNNGILRFKGYNPHRCSFLVHCKPYYREYADSVITKFYSSLHIDDLDMVTFSNGWVERFNISLREPLVDDIKVITDPSDNRDKPFFRAKDCWFREEDVKCVGFLHEIGRFYMIFCITGYYVVADNKDKPKAGIDLGIHNPVCIHDGENTIVIRMSRREIDRINYLERRCEKLQSIMDRKRRRSKNYEKVRRKFRISWNKIFNIRLNWRRKLSKFIAIRYRKVVVDDFNMPDNSESNAEPEKIKMWNRVNRMHAIYMFNATLQHACIKYGCKYVESPKNTTRCCNKCGHINSKVPLDQRVFTCTECGYSIDRDENSARNCYNYA